MKQQGVITHWKITGVIQPLPIECKAAWTYFILGIVNYCFETKKKSLPYQTTKKKKKKKIKC